MSELSDILKGLEAIDKKLELIRVQLEQQGMTISALQQTCAARLRICHGQRSTPTPERFGDDGHGSWTP